MGVNFCGNGCMLLAAAPQQGPPPWTFLITMGLVFAMFYFLLIRPQQKERKEREKMLASVKSGDRVVTQGGILGTVTNVKERTVIVRVADNVKIEVLKSALTSVLKPDEEPKG
ncbi:preprotein translocase subunit YajC [Candidatus Methylacidithermus pantelleriae]|nr:preprotein translocase subunit YajC [Candidatus Methylacidithermus pantelleriae]